MTIINECGLSHKPALEVRDFIVARPLKFRKPLALRTPNYSPGGIYSTRHYLVNLGT